MTTVLASNFTPILALTSSAQIDHLYHGPCSCSAVIATPAQSSPNTICWITLHAAVASTREGPLPIAFASNRAPPPKPKSGTPRICSFMTIRHTLRKIFALSGERTHPINHPIQFENGALSPAAVSSLHLTGSLPSNPP